MKGSARGPTVMRAPGPPRRVREGVEAALEQLARDGQAGAVAAEPFGRLEVVVVVGGGGPARALGRFEQRPAQCGGALSGEVAGRAAGVGLVHGDVQAGVATASREELKRRASPSSARIVTDVSGPMP